MIRQLRELAQDVAHYLPRLRERSRLRQGQDGVDYGADTYRELARRATDRLHPRAMQLGVAAVIQETPSTRTFRCERRDGTLPPFRPGQYLSVKLQIGTVRTSRAYSIASAPGEPHVDLTVRLNPLGFASPFLFAEVRAGSVLTTSGPEGSFGIEPLIDRGEVVMLAGGSGITPFMSIVRAARQRGWPQRLALLYGSRRSDDVIFGAELEQLASATDRLRYELVISEPEPDYRGARGFLTGELIARIVGDVRGKTFLVCGPAAMGEHCERELERLGAPAQRIRREIFGSAVDVTRLPGRPAAWPADRAVEVEVVGHGTFAARTGEPLLASLERAGLVVPSTCRTGACAECRVRVEAGSVHVLAERGLREADQAMGYVHSCTSYPLGDLRIRLGR
jgi:glycine betaine catabolism B